jgi:hypothetical protein
MVASCGTSHWTGSGAGRSPSNLPDEVACIAVAAFVLLAGLLQLRAVGLPARPPASRQDPPQKMGDRYG